MTDSDWHEPTLEAAREDIFHLLDLLREAGRHHDDSGQERLELVRLCLIQALRQLEGHVSAHRVPLDALRVPIPGMPVPGQLVDLMRRCEDGPEGALATCRRLLLGPELYVLLTGESHEPEIHQVVEWLRWLRRDAPSHLPWGLAAARLATEGSKVLIELHLDELLDAPTWSHPSQVLARPRPPLEALLEACVARLQQAEGDARQQLLEVREKLERSFRIDETARRRRRNRKARAGE